MKRFLSVLIASMFLASAAFAAEKMGDEKKAADAKVDEKKAAKSTDKMKDEKSDKMTDDKKTEVGPKSLMHPGRWPSPPSFTSYIRNPNTLAK